MDKNKLTTFDDDALDQVSGGVGLDPIEFGAAVGTLIGQSIQDHRNHFADGLARWSTFFQSISEGIRS